MGKMYNRSTGYRSRKRKFHGHKKLDDQNIDQNVSASSKKLKLDTSSCNLKCENELSGYRFVDIKILFKALSEKLCCKTCKSDISFSEDNIRGSASAFHIACKCEYSNSSQINSCEMLGAKKNIPEVNIRLVYGMRCIGVGLQGLETFCALMNSLPPITRKAYDGINKKILCATQAVAKKSMIAASKEEALASGIADVVVSGDGTWKTRGHSSKVGVCSIIGIETGKVIDVEVLTNYCKSCEKNISKHQCVKNHTGSAGSMEVEGMKSIFLRSEVERQVRYAKYLGDGDTKTFSELVKANPYQDLKIEKLECVGHVQKRMGTRLRKLKEKMKGVKLADGKTLSGRGRLTDALIDKISVYYGNAIRNNSDSIENMKKAVWAVYCHMCSSDIEPLHLFCPDGETSWCNFKKHAASGATSDFRHKNSVPVEVIKATKKVFVDLASPELLKKCLSGKTQNQNESFNSTIWRICPKISGASKAIAEIATCEAVATFNDGKTGRNETLLALGLEVGRHSTFATKADNQRLKTAEKRAMMASLESRRAKRQSEKLKNEILKRKEGNSYNPGGF